MNRQRVFNYQEYLDVHYEQLWGDVEQNTQSFQEELAYQAFNDIPESESYLQIGCGPVLTFAAVASKKCQNLYLSEYNAECFEHIRKILNNDDQDSNSFWIPRFQLIAKLEGVGIDKVQKRLRQRVKGCFSCDLTKEQILGINYLKKVDVILSSLCLEAVAKDFFDYSSMIRKIKKYLKKGGYMYFYGVLEQTFYMVKDQKLPCFQLTEEQVQTALRENNFEIVKFYSNRPENNTIQTADLKGIFSVLAKSLD